MVSAIKIDGKRLHELARQGIEVERPARPVTVSNLVVTRTEDASVLNLDATVSSGTYIRVLAQDLGTALGSGGHLRNLRRYRSGSFSEREARTLDQLTADAETARAQGAIPHSVLTPAQALAHLDQTSIGPEDTVHVSRGRALDRVTIGANGPGPYAIVDGGGNLLAVYEATETDRIVPSVVLAAQ
jgi:tRNA pseudouridine55 synthase